MVNFDKQIENNDGQNKILVFLAKIEQIVFPWIIPIRSSSHVSN